MRRGKVTQDRQVLAGAELIAQALRLLRPDASEPRPERLDQIHLVAVLDHPPAQIVQMLGVHARPVVGHQLACAAVGGGQPVNDRVEIDLFERPALFGAVFHLPDQVPERFDPF